jgi:dCMP deaminase
MLSVGWNGSPPGLPNVCEDLAGKTLPTTLHAERNAIDKMTRQGVPTEGSILFVSRAPCFECAKALHGLGLKLILYKEKHDDMTGVAFLNSIGVPTLLPSEMPKGQMVKRS